MTWWMWVLLFLVIVVAAGVFLGLLLRGLWRHLRELFRDLGAAADRLSAVTDELAKLQESTSTASEDPAVFDQPSRLRAQRVRRKGKPRAAGRRTAT